MSIKIGPINIGMDYPPFIIAEMSGNHNQSIEKALQIVEAAARSGVSAIKIQTFTPETMTLKLDHDEFKVKDVNSPWDNSSLFNLYKKAHTPWEWHAAIFAKARSLGIIPFSTPFDSSAVNFLEELGVDCYKIASFENTDIPLIQRIAKTGKPIIISTGMATISELDESIKAAKEAGCENLILLKCTSSYPSSPKFSNLSTIPHMRALFNCEIGLSDHTLGIGVSVASIAFGASVIEKHLTLNRMDGGVDSTFSMEPHEMSQLVRESNQAWEAIGKISYGVTEEEKNSVQFKRSLYITREVKKGEAINEDNVRAIRPGLGMPPKYLNILIGRRFNSDYKIGTPLTWERIE